MKMWVKDKRFIKKDALLSHNFFVKIVASYSPEYQLLASAMMSSLSSMSILR